MNYFQMILNGFVDLSTLQNIILIITGVIIGIVFGAIPGLTTNLAVILFLPVTYALNVLSGIMMLLGIYVGGTYGGSISAILVGTPGTGSAMATVFDGYPLAKKGNPGKALQTALISSTIGGIISSIILLFTAPFISKYIMKFGPPEYFALAVLGISVIAGISGTSIVRGIIIGCLGILFSTVGIDSSSGITRFSFGSIYLMRGLETLPVLIGMFAFPNILNMILKKEYAKEFHYTATIARHDKLSWEEKKKLTPTILKSTAIGSIIGAIPAVGAAIAAMIAYNEERRSSKNSHLFGTGVIEGVAAPEAANNAVTGTSLIPLFTLGIPGSVIAATMIGAFSLHGLEVGPTLFRHQGPLMYAIMVGFIICNIVMFLAGKFLIRIFAQIAKVPQPILITLLALFCLAGAYSTANVMFNVYLMAGAGFFMYFLKKFNFPQAPFILGFILGPLAEENLKNSLIMSDGSWMIFFERPIAVVIIVITIILTFYSMKKTKAVKAKTIAEAAANKIDIEMDAEDDD